MGFCGGGGGGQKGVRYTMVRKKKYSCFLIIFKTIFYMGRLVIIDLQTVVKVELVKWVTKVLKADKNKYWGVLATKYSEYLIKIFFE